ncbi:unnamed protein product [Caenorhabditis auriculariae]|uniref:Uncharacterized protein n=1 Tax=Caenorhabditis auriculariae TaxID=2777116 RepID=A0A8S1GT97_9PELO|nr:unnamed protein product [Caenorhabditis auriculariae]
MGARLDAEHGNSSKVHTNKAITAGSVDTLVWWGAESSRRRRRTDNRAPLISRQTFWAPSQIFMLKRYALCRRHRNCVNACRADDEEAHRVDQPKCDADDEEARAAAAPSTKKA